MGVVIIGASVGTGAWVELRSVVRGAGSSVGVVTIGASVGTGAWVVLRFVVNGTAGSSVVDGPGVLGTSPVDAHQLPAQLEVQWSSASPQKLPIAAQLPGRHVPHASARSTDDRQHRRPASGTSGIVTAGGWVGICVVWTVVTGSSALPAHQVPEHFPHLFADFAHQSLGAAIPPE